jgi:hypothetical protein
MPQTTLPSVCPDSSGFPPVRLSWARTPLALFPFPQGRHFHANLGLEVDAPLVHNRDGYVRAIKSDNLKCFGNKQPSDDAAVTIGSC